ncbi:MAG: hypothetical protein SGILL_001208 [Bacillariaceae sp.]
MKLLSHTVTTFTLSLALLAPAVSATSRGSIRGGAQAKDMHRVVERVTKSEICSRLARDGSNRRCHVEKCFAVHNEGPHDNPTVKHEYSASLIPAQLEGEQGRRIVFYEGSDCNRRQVIGMTSFNLNALDDDEALLRLGMTHEPSSDGSRYIPFAIAKSAALKEEDVPLQEVGAELDVKTAVARKLDNENDLDLIVITPNFSMNRGPFSDEDRGCVSEETVVGASAAGTLMLESQVDSFLLSFDKLPLRTKCGVDVPGRYCVCKET